MVARFRRGTFRVHAGRKRGSGADQVDTRKTLDHLGWRDGFGSVLFGNDHDGRGKPVPDLLRGCVPMENDPVQTRVWRDMFGTLDGTRKRNVSDMQTRNHRARLESSKSPMRAEGTRDALRRIRIFCEYSLPLPKKRRFVHPSTNTTTSNHGPSFPMQIWIGVCQQEYDHSPFMFWLCCSNDVI